MPKDIKELNTRPEARNLISIYSSLTNTKIEQNIEILSGKNFSEFKESLSQVLVDKIEPITKEIKKLLNDRSYIEQILDEGSKKANEIASKKIKEIHKIVGF